MEPEFSTDWLTLNLPEWERILAPLKGKPGLKFLEIGSFEGRSACWFLQNILTASDSRLTCVDPFTPFNVKACKYTWPPGTECPYPDEIHTEGVFDENIRRVGGTERVIKLKDESHKVLRALPFGTYDCVYIDGSHRLHDVLRDAVLSWDLLKINGILIFDDYLLLSHTMPYYSPRIAIDAFMACYNGAYELLAAGWQLFLRKTAEAPSLPGDLRPMWQEQRKPTQRAAYTHMILANLWGRLASVKRNG